MSQSKKRDTLKEEEEVEEEEEEGAGSTNTSCFISHSATTAVGFTLFYSANKHTASCVSGQVWRGGGGNSSSVEHTQIQADTAA